MNPFKEKVKKPEEYLEGLKDLYPTPYDKNVANPYTKARIILACGAEYESNWCSHQLQRSVDDNSLKQALALTRFIEKQQQQKLAMLKPADESILETTISYEQLAVDLTAGLAKCESNAYVKKALDFALLEDFDHLYRYANLLDSDYGIHAERLVGGYTEIIPARPTIAHHRHPVDNVKKCISAKSSDMRTVLNTMIITAAEQQTMNYYMNVGAFYENEAGRKLYQEICLVEEEHVTQYGSLIDPSADPLENHLLHEYCECYLYWSNYQTEVDTRIKRIWEYFLEQEIAHLQSARNLLKKYCKKDYDQVIPNPEFPEPVCLHQNVDYVRSVIENTVQYTSKLTDYKNIDSLEKDDRFFVYNKQFNAPVSSNPSHAVIDAHIKKAGCDYRAEVKEHPVERMRDVKRDEIEIGTTPNLVKNLGFKAIDKSECNDNCCKGDK